MIIEIVYDRKFMKFTNFIEKFVYIGSIIITDRYSSYLSAVKNCMCNHQIVNHSKGLTNEREFYTIYLKFFGLSSSNMGKKD